MGIRSLKLTSQNDMFIRDYAKEKNITLSEVMNNIINTKCEKIEDYSNFKKKQMSVYINSEFENNSNIINSKINIFKSKNANFKDYLMRKSNISKFL